MSQPSIELDLQCTARISEIQITSASSALTVCASLFQVNKLQAQIKDVTRKMMAMVSELSMHEAEAMKLRQEVIDKLSCMVETILYCRSYLVL